MKMKVLHCGSGGGGSNSKNKMWFLVFIFPAALVIVMAEGMELA